MQLRTDQLQESVRMIDGKSQKVQDVDVNGKEVIIDLTVRNAFRKALTASFPDEQNLTSEKKFERFVLATRVWNADVVDLSIEEAALIKTLVAKAWPVEAQGFLWNLLESK